MCVCGSSCDKALRAGGNLDHMVFDHTYFCSSARLTRHDEKNYVVGMYVFFPSNKSMRLGCRRAAGLKIYAVGVWNRSWMVGGGSFCSAISSSRHSAV